MGDQERDAVRLAKQCVDGECGHRTVAECDVRRDDCIRLVHAALSAATEGDTPPPEPKPCALCKGNGFVFTTCKDPQCGDSTWDHECDEGTEPCPNGCPRPKSKPPEPKPDATERVMHERCPDNPCPGVHPWCEDVAAPPPAPKEPKPDPEWAEVVRCVDAFREVMLGKLAENRAKKGCREGWVNDEPSDLLRRVREEVEELDDASRWSPFGGLHGGYYRALVRECADVANMAMMVADAAGALRVPPEPKPDAMGEPKYRVYPCPDSDCHFGKVSVCGGEGLADCPNCSRPDAPSPEAATRCQHHSVFCVGCESCARVQSAALAARDAEIATLRAREEAVENWRCVGPDAPQSDCRSGGADLEEMCTPCAAHELHERWEREKSRADDLAKRLEEAERRSAGLQREHDLTARVATEQRARADAAEATLSEYRKQLDNCEDVLSAVRAELDAAEAKAKEAERRADELDAEAKAINELHDVALAQIESLRVERDEARAESDRIFSVLTEKDRRIAEAVEAAREFKQKLDSGEWSMAEDTGLEVESAIDEVIASLTPPAGTEVEG